tara:strand:- start:204 stop:638 length:435 start_codon:yes stop_codon:yes gene_type:complete
MNYEDKQKQYREKVLADIEKKNQEKKLKAQEKRDKNRDADLQKHLQKVQEFKELHPNKKLMKRFMLVNGEWEKIEICQLLENNICHKESKETEEKWKRINAWREKMKKAGIKAKPRKYHTPPRDLSIHTHSKCRVPALAKRKGE